MTLITGKIFIAIHNITRNKQQILLIIGITLKPQNLNLPEPAEQGPPWN